MLIRTAFRYGDKRMFARLVTLVQGSDTAHCEAAWAWDGDVHECVSSSWLDGGVRGKTIEMPAGKWRIYEVDAAIDPLVYLSQHDGDGYDWLGLLGFVIRRIRGFGGRRFCSEAVAEILGLRDPWRFDPATLEGVIAGIGRRVQ